MHQMIVAKTKVVQRAISEHAVGDFVETETKKALDAEEPREGEPFVGYQASERFLGAALGAFSLEEAAADLRRQTVVMAWSTVEIATRDTFARLLNVRPLLVRRLQADDGAQKRFQLRRLDLDLFLEHGFDLTGVEERA